MFRKTRRKIILSIMGSLILLFVITLSVIMFASWREIRRSNTDMLERYAELYFLDRKPDGTGTPDDLPPDPPDGKAGPRQGKAPLEERPDYRLSTFYTVALGEDGSVLAVDNGGKDVCTEDELIAIARDILNENRASGRTGHLAYVVAKRPGYTLVAFMDNTVTESGMGTLLRNVLIIGLAAIVVLFFIALFLSGRIIRPLEENDRRQKQFISDASHELKTPVSVIGANAEMLSREIGDNEWLGNIVYENDRMGGLVRQLLDLSRAENAEAPMEEVDLSRVVTGETLAFETFAFEQGREIVSDIEDSILVKGDRPQLTQLISILLDNAVRHSTGGVIDLTLKCRGHHAALTVANAGDEIPPEKLEHLFDRFYRVDEARGDEGRHYGLGLSIAKAVAVKHGGSISADCENGLVRFTVLIPLKK